jgi:hypothetical protein
MTQTISGGTEALRASMTGPVFSPDDQGYDEARKVWTADIDRRPAVIARCASARDVVAAVTFAQAQGLEIAVRSGAHGVSGHCVGDAGLMIDLSRMNRVAVDPEAKQARVGGGALLADLDAATQAHGLAVPVGAVSHTGVAGLALGGGMGWLSRQAGLSIDNPVAAEVVVAENPDLFWAIWGGGGNFGVVTEFEFRLHEVGPMMEFGFFFWTSPTGRSRCSPITHPAKVQRYPSCSPIGWTGPFRRSTRMTPHSVGTALQATSPSSSPKAPLPSSFSPIGPGSGLCGTRCSRTAAASAVTSTPSPSRTRTGSAQLAGRRSTSGSPGSRPTTVRPREHFPPQRQHQAPVTHRVGSGVGEINLASDKGLCREESRVPDHPAVPGGRCRGANAEIEEFGADYPGLSTRNRSCRRIRKMGSILIWLLLPVIGVTARPTHGRSPRRAFGPNDRFSSH